MKSCENCVWNDNKDSLHWCHDIQSRGRNMCDRWISDPRITNTICGRCQNDKDPGKCWWCGEDIPFKKEG